LDKNLQVWQTAPFVSLGLVCMKFTSVSLNTQEGDYPILEKSIFPDPARLLGPLIKGGWGDSDLNSLLTARALAPASSRQYALRFPRRPAGSAGQPRR
jgi:hypothetical protein